MALICNCSLAGTAACRSCALYINETKSWESPEFQPYKVPTPISPFKPSPFPFTLLTDDEFLKRFEALVKRVENLEKKKVKKRKK